MNKCDEEEVKRLALNVFREVAKEYPKGWTYHPDEAYHIMQHPSGFAVGDQYVWLRDEIVASSWNWGDWKEGQMIALSIEEKRREQRCNAILKSLKAAGPILTDAPPAPEKTPWWKFWSK
jgi:hypothetical protein